MRRIIYLWGPARSISTAMLKCMSRRDDVSVFHEPFNDCYYYSRGRKTAMYGDRPDRLAYDGAAVERLLRSAPRDIVFVKEMAYLALPYISPTQIGGATNSFIVRDPRLALASRKRHRSAIDEWEFGYTALHRMWTLVTERLGQAPVAMEGERLRAAPERILPAWCAAVGLVFDERMLRWPSEKLFDWQPHEELSQRRWHTTLEGSTGFEPPEPPPAHFDFTAGEWRMIERADAVYARILPFCIGGDDASEQ